MCGGIEVVGCPKFDESRFGSGVFLNKSSRKEPKRCIMTEIISKHIDHVKNFGDRCAPVAAYLGDEEVILVHKSIAEQRTYSSYWGFDCPIEKFRARLRKGEVQVYTPCGRLTLYAVDYPAHLALGGFK